MPFVQNFHNMYKKSVYNKQLLSKSSDMLGKLSCGGHICRPITDKHFHSLTFSPTTRGNHSKFNGGCRGWYKILLLFPRNPAKNWYKWPQGKMKQPLLSR